MTHNIPGYGIVFSFDIAPSQYLNIIDLLITNKLWIYEPRVEVKYPLTSWPDFYDFISLTINYVILNSEPLLCFLIPL